MKILINIGHPGHVHYFKNVSRKLKDNCHEIIFVARDRGIILELLEKEGLKYINRGKGSNLLLGKIFNMFLINFKLLKISLKFKPDLFLSFSSPYAAQVSFILRKPHIALTDTEHEDKMNTILTYPFSSAIITPQSYLNEIGKKHIRFNHVVEGLYLHKRFFAPQSVKKELGLEDEDEYIIMRFVSWNAHHDFGHHGLNMKTKKELINLLKDKYKIFISSEAKTPEEFEKYKINISPDRIHDALAHATLFIGESATMSSECAFLGTHAIYINSLPLMGYLKMEQDLIWLNTLNHQKELYIM